MSEMLQALEMELDIREQHGSLFSSGNNPSVGESVVFLSETHKSSK